MIKQSLAVVATLFAVSGAFAQTWSGSGFAPVFHTEPTFNPDRDANGDLFGARLTGFSGAGGAFIDTTGVPAGDLHTFGMTQLMSTTNLTLAATSAPAGPNAFTLTFRAFTANGAGFTPAGAQIGGQTLLQYGLEIGAGNAPANIVNWTPSPGMTGIIITTASFQIFANGAALGPGGGFTLPINDPNPGIGAQSNGGAGVSVRSFVSIPSGDIGTFGIDEFIITIGIQEVPTPGALALVGVGGLVAVRRRRG